MNLRLTWVVENFPRIAKEPHVWGRAAMLAVLKYPPKESIFATGALLAVMHGDIKYGDALHNWAVVADILTHDFSLLSAEAQARMIKDHKDSGRRRPTPEMLAPVLAVLGPDTCPARQLEIQKNAEHVVISALDYLSNFRLDDYNTNDGEIEAQKILEEAAAVARTNDCGAFYEYTKVPDLKVPTPLPFTGTLYHFSNKDPHAAYVEGETFKVIAQQGDLARVIEEYATEAEARHRVDELNGEVIYEQAIRLIQGKKEHGVNPEEEPDA